jgi:AcrR family transcriptional regulator
MTDNDSDSTTSARETIIRAALEELILQRGSPGIVDIAGKAGLPSSEVRALFKSSDEIYAAYLGDAFERADQHVRAIDGFSSFALREKLHAFFEEMIAQLEPQRAQVPKLTWLMGGAWLRRQPTVMQLRQRLQGLVAQYFREAVERNEIPDVDVHSSVIGSFADYATTVVAYWLTDRSKGHQDTTQFIDQTLAVVLPAALSTARMRDLGQFFRHRLQITLRGKQPMSSAGNGARKAVATEAAVKRVDELGSFVRKRVQIYLGDAEPAAHEADAREGRGRGLRFRFVR